MLYTRKEIIMRLLFAGEVCVFAGLYLAGTRGLHVVRAMKQENDHIERENQQLINAVTHLEQELVAWNMGDFYKEKVAREQLQLARADDEIFYY